MFYDKQAVINDISYSISEYLESKNIEDYSVLKTDPIKVVLKLSITGNYELLFDEDVKVDTDHVDYKYNFYAENLITDTSDDLDVAEELFNDAIDDLIERSSYRRLEDAYAEGIRDRTPSKFADDYVFVNSFEEIKEILDYLGVIDLEDEVSSMFIKAFDGEIEEVWVGFHSIPYNNSHYSLIK